MDEKKTEQQMERVSMALSRVILSHRFIASIVLHLPFVPDYSIPTACTNGETIRVNPDFAATLDMGGLTFVIAHEGWHVVNLHHLRRGDRDPQIWNFAADYVINAILQNDFQLLDGALYSHEYDGMSTEQVYDAIKDDLDIQKQIQSAGSDPGGTGEVRDWMPGDEDGDEDGDGKEGDGEGGKKGKKKPPKQPRKPTESEIKAQEAKVKRQIYQAAMAEKMQGTLPGHLAKLVGELLKPRTNVREVVASWGAKLARNDYSWKRPNRRHHDSPFVLPALRSIDPGTCGLFIDTSGSISERDLKELATELMDVLKIDGISAYIVYCDSRVQRVERVTVDMLPHKLRPYGGGGTDFRPPFRQAEEDEVELVGAVYFTDGYCSSFPEEPEYPVLWIISSNGTKDFKPPFGDVVRIGG